MIHLLGNSNRVSNKSCKQNSSKFPGVSIRYFKYINTIYTVDAIFPMTSPYRCDVTGKIASKKFTEISRISIDTLSKDGKVMSRTVSGAGVGILLVIKHSQDTHATVLQPLYMSTCRVRQHRRGMQIFHGGHSNVTSTSLEHCSWLQQSHCRGVMASHLLRAVIDE